MKITDYTGGYALAQFEQLRTGAFTAEIHRDGKHVIEVENDGRGGSNRYYAVLEESNAEVHALREYAARDFGDFEPADAFVEVLIDIDIIRNYIRRSGARFSEVAEAIIVDSEEAAIPETVSYMQPHFDLLRKIGAALDADVVAVESVDSLQVERVTDISGRSSSTRAGGTARIRRTMFGR